MVVLAVIYLGHFKNGAARLTMLYLVRCRLCGDSGSSAVDPLYSQVGRLLQQVWIWFPVVRQQRRNYVQRQHAHDADC